MSTLDPQKLHAPSATSIIDGDLRSQQSFSPEVSYYTITPKNLSDAHEVVKVCFTHSDEQKAVFDTYQQWLEGSKQFYFTFQKQNLELLTYTVYYNERTPAGISGLYTVEGDTTSAWMGWFGVAPEFRKNSQSGSADGAPPLSNQILEHLKRDAAERGFSVLSAHTDDSPGNFAAHRYYERNGFKAQEVFEQNGERRRVYQLPLEPMTSEQELVKSVRAIRSGKKEILSEFAENRVNAAQMLLRSRIDGPELRSTSEIEHLFNQNQDPTKPYYLLSIVNDPHNPHRPISVATGMLDVSGKLTIESTATAGDYDSPGLNRFTVQRLREHANNECRIRYGKELAS